MDLEAMAVRIATSHLSHGVGDMLHGTGRDAELGQDQAMMETHTDLENDDLENVDNRPKQ